MLPGKFEITASKAGILVLYAAPVGSVKSDTLQNVKRNNKIIQSNLSILTLKLRGKKEREEWGQETSIIC